MNDRESKTDKLPPEERQWSQAIIKYLRGIKLRGLSSVFRRDEGRDVNADTLNAGSSTRPKRDEGCRKMWAPPI